MSKLLDFIKKIIEDKGDTEMAATIVAIHDGFGLFNRDGLVQIYSRERDAKRGAARRGLVVA